MTHGPRLGATGAALLALVLATGCDRKPRLVPAGAESTEVTVTDSTAVDVDQVRDAWDRNASDGSAARATAALLLFDLRQHPVLPLEMRARTLMDSLSLGAEVDGRGNVAVVNFFSLSDPSGGSWPYLFWRDSVTVHSQPVEGRGMRLTATAVRPDSAGRNVQAAALFTRSAAAGTQPLVFVWRYRLQTRRWALSQTLGPDSLGGIGTARFDDMSTDSVALHSRTWRRTPGFEECATCAHVYVTRRFRWGPDGLSTLDTDVEDSPYVAFVRLVEALSVSDLELARDYCADDSVLAAANGYGFGEKRGTWRQAPGGDEVPNEMEFFRGGNEAYRVDFVRIAGRWRISHIETTTRDIG